MGHNVGLLLGLLVLAPCTAPGHFSGQFGTPWGRVVVAVCTGVGGRELQAGQESRGRGCTTHPLPSRKCVSGAHVRGDAVPFRLASAMLFSISQGMCLLCESPPLLHGAQLVPARQGMPLLRGLYLIPTTRALCQENTTVQNICEDVKACPEPSKYRCARASKAPAASVVQRYGCCAFPVAGNLP